MSPGDDRSGDHLEETVENTEQSSDSATESRSSGEGELTEGSLLRPMFHLAWPLVVIQLLQVAYNVGDTFWLGALSPDAVGALSLAFPLIFLLISIGGGFTAAGAILIAQHTGADSGKGGLIAGQTLSFISIVAVVLGILGYFVTDPMLALLPADAETEAQIIPLAADYMRIFFLGMPFLFGFFIFVSLMRGYGNTHAPMRVMVVSVVINLVIDPLLIFGVGPFPRLEIEGAAIATIISRGVATAIGFYILFYTDVGPEIRAPHLVPRFEYVSKITRLGVPTALEQSMSALAMVTMTAMVATFPPAVVAAYGLGNRLISLAFLPAMGMGQATDTIVGQNLGAGKPDRAEKATWVASGVIAAIMFVAALIAFLFTEPIVGVFMTADVEGAAETIAYGMTDVSQSNNPCFERLSHYVTQYSWRSCSSRSRSRSRSSFCCFRPRRYALTPGISLFLTSYPNETIPYSQKKNRTSKPP